MPLYVQLLVVKLLKGTESRRVQLKALFVDCNIRLFDKHAQLLVAGPTALLAFLRAKASNTTRCACCCGRFVAHEAALLD
mmetsp:Transcript_55894/g.96264  ORF Transcript_55894/g.96264 Transcript_55894/m.96264 type:complete len:80 (-) Transcript_55894:17-256(-)